MFVNNSTMLLELVIGQDYQLTTTRFTSQ